MLVKTRTFGSLFRFRGSPLAEVRTALVKTQDEVARVLNVKQNAVAQLEKLSDLLLSTLWKCVEAVGGELAVAVRTGAGTVIVLDSLSSLAKPMAPKRARGVSMARSKPAARHASKAQTKADQRQARRNCSRLMIDSDGGSLHPAWDTSCVRGSQPVPELALEAGRSLDAEACG